MIERNLKKTLASVNGDMGQAHQTVQEWLGSMLGFLESLVEHHTKILVIVWKDFTDSANSQAFGISPLVKGDSLGGEENGLLKHFYFAMKEQHPEKFEFMPYQPGDYSISDEVATSIDAVAFIGKFFLPQSAIEELNRTNGSKIDMIRYSLAELVKQTFRSRCQFGKPVTIYFTSDWKKDFIQQFLTYTDAKDIKGNSLTVLSHDELLEQKLKGMELSKPQRHHVSKIVEAYPEFEDSLSIELPIQEVKDLLGKGNIRDLREILENLKKKDIHITLL